MILLYILAGVAILAAIIGAFKGIQDYDWEEQTVGERIAGFFLYGIGAGVVLGMVFMLAQVYGQTTGQKPTDVTYSQQLVSIKDGTGVEGRFSGGLFVSRGYIQDTQVFTYYRVVAPGQYSLDKRNATQSVIVTDATADTARVDITDRVYTCEPTWYMPHCQPKANEFVWASFHVPADSIQQTYELDAQ